MTPASARDKIIFALDVDCREEISRWATLLSDRVGMFKVGKELFTSCASEIFHVSELKLRKAINDVPSLIERFTYSRERCLAYIEAALLS